MNSFNGYNNRQYFDSHPLRHEFTNNGNNSSLQLSDNTMSSMNEPLAGIPIQSMPPFTPFTPSVCNNPLLTPLPYEAQPSAMSSVKSMNRNESIGCSQKYGFECNESKIELNLVLDYLENLRQNSERFQTNVLNELKQMKEVMKDVKNAINEMPVRFADVFTQSFGSIHSRSRSLSVDSEPEVIDVFDKINISDNDCNEDNGFVQLSNKIDPQEMEIKSTPNEKFVFPYDPYIDLDKWLKKD